MLKHCFKNIALASWQITSDLHAKATCLFLGFILFSVIDPVDHSLYLQLSDSWLSLPWLLVILLMRLGCCFLGSYQTPSMSLLSGCWHQLHTTRCSLPSQLSYSCWAVAVRLVSGSHPASADGPPVQSSSSERVNP